MNNAIICNNIQFLLRPQAPFLESLTGWVGSPNWTCFFTSQIPFLSQSATKATVSEQWQKITNSYTRKMDPLGISGTSLFWGLDILPVTQRPNQQCQTRKETLCTDPQLLSYYKSLQVSISKKRYSPHTAYKTYYITCKRRAWATVILESSFLVKSVANS